MPLLVLASCFARARGVATGRECERVSERERKNDASEGSRQKESVLERRNTALAQLCGTFDMSFKPSLKM